jgi:hypothetical protein
LVVVFVVTAVSACSFHSPVTSTPEQTVRAKRAEPPLGRAIVYIYEFAEAQNPMCDVDIFVNTQPVGSIGPEMFLAIELAPGTYVFDMDLHRAGMCAPAGLDSILVERQLLQVSVADNARYFLRTGYKAHTGWAPLGPLGLLAVFLAAGSKKYTYLVEQVAPNQAATEMEKLLLASYAVSGSNAFPEPAAQPAPSESAGTASGTDEPEPRHARVVPVTESELPEPR